MSILLADEAGFGAVRNTDPATSRRAARRNAHGREEKYALILTFLGLNGPSTNEEIAVGIGAVQISDISPRVSEMLQDHKLVAVGTKKSSRGSAMRVVDIA